jgi:hypothetical protein
MTANEIAAIVTQLQTALGSGAASITFDGRKIDYTGADNILKAITYFQGLQTSALTTAGTVRRKVILMQSRSGL